MVDADPADVAAVAEVFAADFTLPRAPDGLRPVGDDLTWSPSGAPPPGPSVTHLTGQAALDVARMIDSACASLWVENEELSDGAILGALVRAARRGVRVRLIMTGRGDEPAWAELRSAGAQVARSDPGAPIYIHAKVMVADGGLADQRAFVGSQNFSAPSLDDNRELGIITGDPRLVRSLGDQLAADFAHGRLLAPGPRD